MLFTDTKIRSMKPKAERYEFYEKHGFGIRVQPTGHRSFIYKFTSPTRHKQRRMTLGTYPAMTLAQAHTAHARAREIVLGGKDPADRKLKYGKLESLPNRQVIDPIDNIEQKPECFGVGGVYFLLLDDIVIYVGQSKDIGKRIFNGHLKKDWNRYAFKEIAPQDRDHVEALYIGIYCPELNRGNVRRSPLIGSKKRDNPGAVVTVRPR